MVIFLVMNCARNIELFSFINFCIKNLAWNNIILIIINLRWNLNLSHCRIASMLHLLSFSKDTHTGTPHSYMFSNSWRYVQDIPYWTSDVVFSTYKSWQHYLHCSRSIGALCQWSGFENWLEIFFSVYFKPSQQWIIYTIKHLYGGFI